MLIPEDLKQYVVKRLDGKSLDEDLLGKQITKLIVKCAKCGKERQTNYCYFITKRHILCESCKRIKSWIKDGKKTCSMCGEIKPLSEFRKKANGKYVAHCKKCFQIHYRLKYKDFGVKYTTSEIKGIKEGDGIYYVYIYLDPRKQGEYKYNDFLFDYQPFYVGKGKGIRYKAHLRRAYRLAKKDKKLLNNKRMVKRITEIWEDGKEPIIIRLRDHLLEEDALKLEDWMVSIIGRECYYNGPLLNINDGGLKNVVFYGEMHWMHIHGSPNKGKTFDELYGKEESKRMRKILSEKNSGENSAFGRKAKGKTYEEIYGYEKAQELKRKRREMWKDGRWRSADLIGGIK